MDYDRGRVEREMYAFVERAFCMPGGPRTRSEQAMAMALADEIVGHGLVDSQAEACGRSVEAWAAAHNIACETALAAYLAATVVEDARQSLRLAFGWFRQDMGHAANLMDDGTVEKMIWNSAGRPSPGTVTLGFSPISAGDVAIRVSTEEGTLVTSYQGDPGLYDGLDVSMETADGLWQLAVTEVIEATVAEDGPFEQVLMYDAHGSDVAARRRTRHGGSPAFYADATVPQSTAWDMMPPAVGEALSGYVCVRRNEREGPVVEVRESDETSAPSAVFDFRGRIGDYSTKEGWVSAAGRALEQSEGRPGQEEHVRQVCARIEAVGVERPRLHR